MKNVPFKRSIKFGDVDEIQPWKDDQGGAKYSKETKQAFFEKDVQAGMDVVGEDVFSGGTQYGGSTSKGYKPQTSEAAKQLIRERATFDIDTEIELYESIHKEYQGQKMSIDIQNKPGVQAKELKTNVAETAAPDYTTTKRMAGEPSLFKVTSEGIIEEWSTRPVGIKSRKPIGIKGVDLATSRKAFQTAEKLSSLKLERANIVRNINKELYGVAYDTDVLTESDFKKAEVLGKAQGITTSEAVPQVKASKPDLTAIKGDPFEAKAEYKQTSAYDYSPIEEGNQYRDLQTEIEEKRFGMTTIDERIAATGTGKFTEYPKGGGKGGVTQPTLTGKLELSGSSMTGGGVQGLGYKQADLLEKSIVPFKTRTVDNVAQLPFSVSDYERQAIRILGRAKGKQHMKNIIDPGFQTPADPKAPSAIVKSPTVPDMRTTPISKIQSGPAYNELMRVHQKIETAAAEYADIRKDIKDTMGGTSKADIQAYFKGEKVTKTVKLEGRETKVTYNPASGAFRDVRSATIAGINTEGLNLPAISAKRSAEIAGKYGDIDNTSFKTFTGTEGLKQPGPKPTMKEQVVVPNPQPEYTRRATEYKKRDLSLQQRAEKILSTPGVGLSDVENAVQKELKKAVKAVGSVGAIKGLKNIMGPITKTNPALAGLSLLPKNIIDDIIKPKKPEA